MKAYRSILQVRLKDANIGHREIADRMGWASNATVSLKLAGKRDWSEGELKRMCDIAGITIAWLSSNSDDLILTKHSESTEIAVLVDELSDSKRLQLLNQIKEF